MLPLKWGKYYFLDLNSEGEEVFLRDDAERLLVYRNERFCHLCVFYWIFHWVKNIFYPRSCLYHVLSCFGHCTGFDNLACAKLDQEVHTELGASNLALLGHSKKRQQQQNQHSFESFILPSYFKLCPILCKQRWESVHWSQEPSCKNWLRYFRSCPDA